MPRFSIIMPAYKAAQTIVGSLSSLFVQDLEDFEVMLVADDGEDYEALLAQQSVSDPRIRFLSTGAIGTGSSHARNVALDAASSDLIAILDADDWMRPGKLRAMAEALEYAPMVSTGLDVTDADGALLRTVGVGEDKDLPPAEYKFTCFSMDSMIAYDRRKGDPRYDRDLPCLTDLDLILKLFESRESCRHLGAAWHAYVKQPVSITNGPGASDKIARTKVLMLERLRSGHYPMKDENGPAGFIRFLELSLEAEKTYGARLDAEPGLLFEDHIQPLLEAESTS